ncbi:DUF4232 domain-containing protein [Streptomyces rimosus]|uniref:DUF4232 domain-containing protein n=1 Tax=Streptomyces rimosus TaxID=1927 RepID=UPI001F379BAF|nr:DUF4232 domain-containing protein [Streptomyces rimosus]
MRYLPRPRARATSRPRRRLLAWFRRHCCRRHAGRRGRSGTGGPDGGRRAGARSHRYPNTSGRTCTLHGFPGVRLISKSGEAWDLRRSADRPSTGAGDARAGDGGESPWAHTLALSVRPRGDLQVRSLGQRTRGSPCIRCDAVHRVARRRG